ncbi:DUF1343 domain-containing protein [Leptospira levettii]|uniref:DUF1343 domain-containing protein n=1 Tax=Leptospira levettii TaxID=2023178 RepID=A0AAW5VH44_9LEPT|nr:DUF1343 domain-containing protein [Leptospira levettii]MCW7467102.1 DUF1343 domain-containing protein [Leptospira levettii]MCW7497781.1 DUF1343 domain-containing protein [Leptospira levettii]MCW7512824.1 DUF1343 domain-containing protein [Leptospira levettii]MCW7516546.1 DUF1343 domain-containing protein [Leptospira levettii]TGL11226.1 DUF1343 domain-containing protein [Leptospira levettii]
MKFLKNIQKLSGCLAGILTNQSAFGYLGKYHFQTYSEIFNLKTIFLPEHGLFAELQDQVSGDELSYLFGEMQIVNLYGKEESSLVPPKESLKNLDVVIIDIKDVGSRYYTFLTTAYYILEELSKLKKETGKSPVFLVIDSPNPIGTKVEGSPLQETYESFVGVKSVLHRHGLTPGGLLTYYNETFHLNVDVVVVPVGVFHPNKVNSFEWVPPSPNIPTQNTCYVYPGMCLLEGTNLSEGRGTTKPFETFGAPYLLGKEKLELDKRLLSHQKGSFLLRNLRFLPTFHKYAGIICEGYQLMVLKPKQFHSLYFTLYFLKQIHELFPNQFEFLKGVYEFRSDRPAIELLAGDSYLLDYLYGKYSDSDLERYLEEKESVWNKAIKPFRY